MMNLEKLLFTRNSDIQSLNSRIAELEVHTNNYLQEISLLKAQCLQNHSEINNYRHQLQVAEDGLRDVNQLKYELNTLNEVHSQTEIQRQSLINDLTEKNSEVSRLNDIILSLQEKLDNTQHQEVEENTADALSNLEGELEYYKSQFISMEYELQETKEENNTLQQQLKDISTTSSDVSVLQNQIKQLNDTIAKRDDVISRMHNVFSENLSGLGAPSPTNKSSSLMGSPTASGSAYHSIMSADTIDEMEHMLHSMENKVINEYLFIPYW
jgi:chromosome segregation ATPase